VNPKSGHQHSGDTADCHRQRGTEHFVQQSEAPPDPNRFLFAAFELSEQVVQEERTGDQQNATTDPLDALDHFILLGLRVGTCRRAIVEVSLCLNL